MLSPVAALKAMLPPGGMPGCLLFLCLALFACAAGRPVPDRSPMSIEELIKYCGLPAPCSAQAPWQGRAVSVVGFLDSKNIVNKQDYPQLPYEKFKLTDDQGKSVEIWAQAADNHSIFEKLARRPSDRIVVHGRLAAVRAPIMGSCKLGVKVLIDDANQIEF